VIKSGQIVGGGKREGKMGEMEGEREKGPWREVDSLMFL
jgi:hypothetical protein